MERDFASWLAGFIDGEGCFYFRERGHGREASVSITQSGQRGRDVLTEIKLFIGSGCITPDNRTSPPKQVWRLAISKGADVKKLIGLILPHLRIKRLEAEALLQKI